MKENSIIEIKNLYSIYNEKQDNSFVALRNINHTFERGKIYFIIGKSGCGKSTLLSYFNGLSYPQYGSIQILDFNLNSNKNLNDTILNEIVVPNNMLILPLFKNIDTNNKKIIILQCSNDTNKNDLMIKFNDFQRNCLFAIKKIPQHILTKWEIKSKNKFYACLVDNNFISPFNKINPSNTSTINIKSYTGKLIKRKKIKNYKQLRKNVGVVYQFPEYQLFKSTILDEVMFGPINLGYSKQEAKNNSIDTLKKLDINEEYFSHSPFNLSGGQKRRVALSGVLAINPQILVFDEPTAGLDPHGEKEMLKIILNAKKEGKTIFVVTHSMEQVLEIGDEVIVIDDGKIIKNGVPYEIFLDEQIVKTAAIVIPKTIAFINDLVKINDKYKILYKLQPKNAYELSNYLVKIRKTR